MPHWLDRIANLLEADTVDLRELARRAGGEPESFYIGTRIDGADLRGQDLVGMAFGPFDPTSVVIDDRTKMSDVMRDAFAKAEAALDQDQPSGIAGNQSPGLVSSPSFWKEAFPSDLAFELDSVTTRIYRKDQGIVLEEPSAYLTRSGNGTRGIMAGSQAVARVEADQSSSFELVSPFSEEKLADVRFGTTLIRLLLKQAIGRASVGADALLCVPSNATSVQRRALASVMKNVGARKVDFVERGLAAAIGAGLPVHETRGVLILDVGSATTDVAIVCLSGTVCSRTLRAGTTSMNEAIMEMMRRHHLIEISLEQAEQLRLAYGHAGYHGRDAGSVVVRGASRAPHGRNEAQVRVSSISDAMVTSISEIIQGVKIALEATPPELAVEIGDDGLIMTGAGATIRGLDAELRDHTGLPVRIARDPHLCVILGGGKILEHPKWRKGITGA
jgi:rod shape-determining protein MreB